MLSLVAAAASAYSLSAGLRTPHRSAMASVRMEAQVFDQEKFIAESKEMRLKHLEEQARQRLCRAAWSRNPGCAARLASSGL